MLAHRGGGGGRAGGAVLVDRAEELLTPGRGASAQLAVFFGPVRAELCYEYQSVRACVSLGACLRVCVRAYACVCVPMPVCVIP